MGTYSVKSDFPKTKALNLYFLVSLPASLPRTDYAKLPCLPHGKDPPSPFLVRVCIYGLREAAKTKPCLVLLHRTKRVEMLTFMNYVHPLADMWDIWQSCRRVMHQITVQNSRGTHPSRSAPVLVMSNECQIIMPHLSPDGRSNHYFTLRRIRFSIISFKKTTYCFCYCSASRGTHITLVYHDTWDRTTGHAPPATAR